MVSNKFNQKKVKIERHTNLNNDFERFYKAAVSKTFYLPSTFGRKKQFISTSTLYNNRALLFDLGK